MNTIRETANVPRRNTDHLYITRAEIDHLETKLGLVGNLVQEMSEAWDGQARMNDGPATSRAKPHSKPPYPIHLQDEQHTLAVVLHTVATKVSTARHLGFAAATTYSMSRWLIRHSYDLAVMPTAPDLFEAVCKQIDHCARMMNQLDPEYVIDPEMVERANRQVMTSVQIEKVARKLGDECKGLNKNRVDSLRRNHGLAFTKDPETGVFFYRLGDAITAHKTARRYKTRKAS